MNLSGQWVRRGYFDFSQADRGRTPTLAIREELCTRLGLPKAGLKIARYPVGVAWGHSYWWRQGDRDYAEAQFFMRIAESYPVLSLGVSVEKGLEDLSRIPTGKKKSRTMTRREWDWPRFVRHAPVLFKTMVPAASRACGRPAVVRISVHQPSTKLEKARKAYTFIDGSWFESHEGTADVEKMRTEVRDDLDRRRDWWINVYIGTDFSPEQCDGMSPAEVATVLFAFNDIREKLRR